MDKKIGIVFNMRATITCEYCQNQFTDSNLRGVLMDVVGEIDVVRLLAPTICDNGHLIYGFNAFNNQIIDQPIHRMN
jgi:hypothetical protein